MENAEEVMQILERFTRLKQKEIPKELDDYLQYVAKTGDTVFKWANLKYLFREKLLNVITHFHDTTPRMDEIPQYPNVDPFNYESMKSSLLERLELFNAAPFTIQRLCELLIDPKKQYNRIDKFMRALEKNILVSTVEPGRKRTESENGDSLDSVVNGDISLDVNVDIDMENESLFSVEATQNGNGTASAVSPVGTAESTNDTESVSDTKPEDESETVVNVTSTHEPPTADDEDLQPSPKKAKLDADVEVAATTTKIIETTTKPVVEEVTIEKIEPTEKVAVVAKIADEEKKAEETEPKKLETPAEDNVDKEESAKTTEKPATTDESKQENKKALKNETKIETDAKTEVVKDTKKDEIVESTSDATSTITTTSITSTDNEIIKEKTEVDAGISKEEDKLDEISSAVEESEQQEAAEKIIEKQEIEKCEKELLPTKKESETSNEKESESPTQSENEKTVEPKANTVADVKEEPKNKKESTEQTKNEAEVVTDSKAAPKDNKTAVDTAVETPSKVESEAEKLITSSSTAITASEVKTEDIDTCVTTTEDAKSVEPVPKIIEPATAITSTSSNEATITKEVETTSEAETPAAPIDEELPAVKTDAVEKLTAESTVSVAATAADAIVAIAPPTLALNDQPMDEDAITNVVDEVIMAESITSSAAAVADGVEMATDAMEATVSSDAVKIDEPADGMDVDDTSPQEEAMDQ